MTQQFPELTPQQFPEPTPERLVNRLKLSGGHEPSDNAQITIFSLSNLSINLPTQPNGNGDITKLKCDVHTMFPGLNKIAYNLSPTNYSGTKYDSINEVLNQVTNMYRLQQR